MYLPRLRQLHQPPDDPKHTLCPPAGVSAAVSAVVDTVVLEASLVLGSAAVPQVEVAAAAAAVLEAVVD